MADKVVTDEVATDEVATDDPTIQPLKAATASNDNSPTLRPAGEG
jgi:hypothetical protein